MGQIDQMDNIENLEDRISIFGNHYQKYLLVIKRYKDDLVNALEHSGKLLQVHLWRSSSAPADEMKIIGNLKNQADVKVKFLSCYYAFQYLHMHFRNLDILGLKMAAEANHAESYHDFMIGLGSEFRELTKAYIQSLLDIYLPAKDRPLFFICSVGTRADQDDIDIGIITEEEMDTDAFNNALFKIVQNMLVYATPMHLYLSEHIGKDLYSSTISEYDEALSKRIQDVVIISELINARFVLGSKKLFRKFQKEIMTRYYYQASENNLHHEGFLRGILGEIRANLLYQPQSEYIVPKYDALRMLKSFLYAKKSIMGIQEVNAWDILEKLITIDKEYKTDYELLYKAISFLEIFKFFLQLFVIQEERFRIAELDHKQLKNIAVRMGYESIGMVSDWDQLLIDYYRYVREVRRICNNHLKEISSHLENISVFKEFRNYKKGTFSNEKNIHLEFIRTARFFEGAKFWDDLLNILEENSQLLEKFISDFEALNERGRALVIDNYARWTQYSIITMTRYIIILGKHFETILESSFFYQLNLAYLKHAYDMPRSIEWFCRVFSFYPNLLHQYFQVMPNDHFKYMNQILDKPLISDELRDVYSQLKELCNIHQWSSRYFHRFFYRIIHSHPEYLKSLTNPSISYQVASGLLAMADITEDIEKRKEIIGNYYDFEFLRCGIGTMKGNDLLKTNQEFTQFCDMYLTELFDICSYEVEMDRSYKNFSTDKIAILAAGGHARSQAYDDDYDLIALIDSKDDKAITYATRIISKMNREIVKRGLLPHYRMGEVLGNFVNPITQVVEYLSCDDEESFIDLSQLLSARMIIGNEYMKSMMTDKIIQPFIFDDQDNYIYKMIREVQNRQRSAEQCIHKCNIKETLGGLRDIEAIALIIKAYTKSNEPITQNFFMIHKDKFPEIAKHFETLYECAYFLRSIRNLYRITEAAEDELNLEYIGRLSNMIANTTLKEKVSSNLYEDIRHHLKRSAIAIEAIINYLTTRLKR